MATPGHGQYQQMIPQHREGQQQGQPFQGTQGPTAGGMLQRTGVLHFTTVYILHCPDWELTLI